MYNVRKGSLEHISCWHIDCAYWRKFNLGLVNKKTIATKQVTIYYDKTHVIFKLKHFTYMYAENNNISHCLTILLHIDFTFIDLLPFEILFDRFWRRFICNVGNAVNIYLYLLNLSSIGKKSFNVTVKFVLTEH